MTGHLFFSSSSKKCYRNRKQLLPAQGSSELLGVTLIPHRQFIVCTFVSSCVHLQSNVLPSLRCTAVCFWIPLDLCWLTACAPACPTPRLVFFSVLFHTRARPQQVRMIISGSLKVFWVYIPGFVILGNESNLSGVQFMDFSYEKRKLEEKQRSVYTSVLRECVKLFSV